FVLLLSWSNFVRSTTRSQGAPHSGQQPFALVPARMHRSASSGGNVAKCAPLYGFVAMVQTERALRPVPSSSHGTLAPSCDPGRPRPSPYLRSLLPLRRGGKP